MKLIEKINFGGRALQSVIFKKKALLSVTFRINFRCNLRCDYCASWQKKLNEELDTQSILNIIEELAGLGTKFIKISGGEPLLRNDLGDIIEFCKSKKMYVYLNSNGMLVNKHFSRIKSISEIQLSLDGPPEVNDALRGKGVYDKVIEAIKICKANNIKVFLNTVISKNNISHVPYLVNLAQEQGIGVYFQPVAQNLSTDSTKDINLLYGPDRNEYQKVITNLIKMKSKGNKFISNSVVGLNYLYNWPKPTEINCLISLISMTIEPDGRVCVCPHFPDYEKYIAPIKGSIKQTFENLNLPHPCNNCWCDSLAEFNLIERYRVDTMLGMWKRL